MIPKQLTGMIAKCLSLHGAMCEQHLVDFLFLHDVRVGSQSYQGTGLPWIVNYDRLIAPDPMPKSLPLSTLLKTLPHRYKTDRRILEPLYTPFTYPTSPWRAAGLRKSHALWSTDTLAEFERRNHPDIVAFSVPRNTRWSDTKVAMRNKTPLMI